jgi:uncharacterized protein YjiS (DUF1127 family)
MSLVIRRTSTLDVIGAMSGFAASIAVALRRQRAQADSYAVLRDLSDEQLRDAGIDRAMIEPARPAIEVSAGLMANLMNMR